VNAAANPPVGYIGLGKMGGPMARRLLDAGLAVHVYGRSEEKLRPYLERGAVRCTSPREVAEKASVILTCLTDTAALEDVVFGEAGLARAPAADRILVDMSTVDPEVTRLLAAKAFGANRLRWVDAPVSGGTVGAEAGTLAIMAGGDSDDVKAVSPVLAHLGRQVTHMGPVGAGQTTKLINQIIVAVTMGMVAEAAGLAVRAGIDAERIPQALSGGRADSTILQQMWGRFIREDYGPTGTVESILKDIALLRKLSGSVGAPLPFTSMAGEHYRWLEAQGHGEEDLTAMFRYFGAGAKR
jgi:3-hydroxyisobutyrate dehydrogenase